MLMSATVTAPASVPNVRCHFREAVRRASADTNIYRIRIQGHLDKRWATWFDGMTVTHETGGATLLEGDVADQAARHGLLQRIRDTGLTLISVEPILDT